MDLDSLLYIFHIIDNSRSIADHLVIRGLLTLGCGIIGLRPSGFWFLESLDLWIFAPKDQANLDLCGTKWFDARVMIVSPTL